MGWDGLCSGPVFFGVTCGLLFYIVLLPSDMIGWREISNSLLVSILVFLSPPSRYA